MSIVLLTSNVHIATSETSTIATGVHVSHPPTNMYTSLEDIVKYWLNVTHKYASTSILEAIFHKGSKYQATDDHILSIDEKSTFMEL